MFGVIFWFLAISWPGSDSTFNIRAPAPRLSVTGRPSLERTLDVVNYLDVHGERAAPPIKESPVPVFEEIRLRTLWLWRREEIRIPVVRSACRPWIAGLQRPYNPSPPWMHVKVGNDPLRFYRPTKYCFSSVSRKPFVLAFVVVNLRLLWI